MAGLRVVAVLLLGAGLSSCLDPPLRRPVSSECVDLVEHKPGEEPPDTVEWDWFQVVVTWVSPEATGGAFAFQMFGNERSRRERMPPDQSEPRRTVYREDAPPHLQIGDIHVGEPAWWSQALHFRVFGHSSCDTMERVIAGRPLPAPSALCDRSPIMELLGGVAIAVVIYIVMSMSSCNEEEGKLAMKEGAGLCHKVGTWCSSCIRVFGKCVACIEHTTGKCCFNSKLARIVNEQGRVQVGKGWGSGKNPDCSGFTIAQLQRLDFAAMDLTEFYASIGMNPLRIESELPGYVSDRLQEAMWREALHMVADGAATTEQIDAAITD
ncbi:conjugal transfer protein TraN, partial [bacterium]|nr:conjugal transfer protein TraN [bacterium]